IRIIENTVLPELKSIREKFRSYRTLLAEAAFKEVEHYASEIFEELTEGKYSGIVLKREIERNREKVKVRVMYQGNEKDISFLSGGELISLGLAFRLALSMFMIKGKVPILILDEPTPFLDEERRKKLVDIMNGYLKRIPQVIVVSHDDELKDAADRVISVEFSGGASKVSIQEW
ncbi:DNA repair protein Rad50, partial [Archaeoglobales archaeon]